MKQCQCVSLMVGLKYSANIISYHNFIDLLFAILFMDSTEKTAPSLMPNANQLSN